MSRSDGIKMRRSDGFKKEYQVGGAVKEKEIK